MYTQERERLQEIDRARRYYGGDRDPPLKVLPGKADDNVYINLVRPLIDKACDFLGIPAFECDSDEDKAWLDALCKAWKFTHKWRELSMAGALAGQWYTRLTPGVKPALDGVTYPRLIVLDPETMRVYWNDDDAEDVTEYRQQWTSRDDKGKPLVRRIRTYRDGERWRVEDATGKDETFERFALLTDTRWEINSDVPWPYEWSPVLDGRNLPAPAEYYGLPDVTDDMLELQDAINLSMTNISRILRFHAHPKTIGTGINMRKPKSTKDTDGDKGSELESGPDSFWTFPESDAKVYNLEMQSDLTSSQAFYESLRSGLFTAARTPDPRLLAELSGDVTNFRLQILFGELLAKTETKRSLYEEGLLSLVRHAAELAGRRMGEVRVEWPQSVPLGDKEELAIAKAEIDLGLASKATWMERRGYDPETEGNLIEGEQEAAMQRQENVGSALLREFSGGRG
jgi:hypothetical protein